MATPPGTPQLHSPKSRQASEEACTLLHIATISGVLAALMRHFRRVGRRPGLHRTMPGCLLPVRERRAAAEHTCRAAAEHTC